LKPLLQKNTDKELYGTYMQAPFQSALYDICIEKGMDVMSGAAAPNMAFGISLAGAPNVGDALAAVKKLVFEGCLAVEILALGNPELASKLDGFRRSQAEKIKDTTLPPASR